MFPRKAGNQPAFVCSLAPSLTILSTVCSLRTLLPAPVVCHFPYDRPLPFTRGNSLDLRADVRNQREKFFRRISYDSSVWLVFIFEKTKRCCSHWLVNALPMGQTVRGSLSAPLKLEDGRRDDGSLPRIFLRVFSPLSRQRRKKEKDGWALKRY